MFQIEFLPLIPPAVLRFVRSSLKNRKSTGSGLLGIDEAFGGPRLIEKGPHPRFVNDFLIPLKNGDHIRGKYMIFS
ncbi:hypothetical protein C4565_04885 [Candidatus Parcubacteria bacterium]|nr:MAG: hypothetical protein C4565_04885 [Candidatus Parcubacteria bacterium]